MKLQKLLEKIMGIWYEEEVEESPYSIPKALEPYVNIYGENAEEFKRRYVELK